MLSLLSLILASGTVLRADTEQWSASTYPDPRTNSTQCNTWPNSTLCDPDHILTDQWRLNIHENINRQIENTFFFKELRKIAKDFFKMQLENCILVFQKLVYSISGLRDADILYSENAPTECHENRTEGVKIYVILAKRIQTASNHSTTDTDLTEFGNEVAEQYGLNSLPCKNFLIIVGVEAAKLAYVRVSAASFTGRDLKLPANLMEHVFNQYTALFNAKNYMEGLNNIINEIGEQMINPFKAQASSNSAEAPDEATTTSIVIDESTTPEIVLEVFSSTDSRTNGQLAPWWMYVVMIVAIVLAIVALSLLFFTRYQARKRTQTLMQTIISTNINDNDNCNSTKMCKNILRKHELEAKCMRDGAMSVSVADSEKKNGNSNGNDMNNTSLQTSVVTLGTEEGLKYMHNGAVGDTSMKRWGSTIPKIEISCKENVGENVQSIEHSPYALQVRSVCAADEHEMESGDEGKSTFSSSAISDIGVYSIEEDNLLNKQPRGKLPSTNQEVTLTPHENINASQPNASSTMRTNSCNEVEARVVLKDDDQFIVDETLSSADSDDLEHHCEVMRPTTPPKIATKV
uniref:SEA domain-containing protein n=1 Tax=Ascaris lumbricoides TaxID=6252 RepID=A0A9J2PVP7_ASCLU